ncbi:MAG: sugar ABC transporter permease, partial [Jannaschia helgolandensis]
MTDVTTPAARPRRGWKALDLDTRLLGMIGAFIVIAIAFDIASGGRFITPRNLFNLTIQTASVAIM